MKNSLSEQRAITMYTKIIRFYPKSYQAGFGLQKISTFRDHYRDVVSHGGTVGGMFWFSVAGDEIKQIYKEQVEEMSLHNNHPNLLRNISIAAIGLISGTLAMPNLLGLSLATQLIWVLAGLMLGMMLAPIKRTANIAGAIYGASLSCSYWFILCNVDVHGVNIWSTLFVVMLVSGLGSVLGIMLTRIGLVMHQVQNSLRTMLHMHAA